MIIIFESLWTGHYCLTKAELWQVVILFGTQFPSLGFFISNKSWILKKLSVRGQSVFFNWALKERNIQVRLYLKAVLKS